MINKKSADFSHNFNISVSRLLAGLNNHNHTNVMEALGGSSSQGKNNIIHYLHHFVYFFASGRSMVNSLTRPGLIFFFFILYSVQPYIIRTIHHRIRCRHDAIEL